MTLSRNAPMRRGEPLKPKRWGVRAKPKKANWRDDFLPDWMTAEDAPKLTPFERSWLAFVRTLPCCCAHLGGCRGRVQASHITLSKNEKGTAMKVDVKQTVPHCDKHHRDWDGRNGYGPTNPFAGLTKDEKFELGREWVNDVNAAATPGDSRDHADELERIGLGKVFGNGGDGWWWMPGPLREVDGDSLGDAASVAIGAAR